nr:hypothetical protein [Burkholderiaceae bacterium]
LDNQMGLLTANFGDAVLEIVDSEFGKAPKPAGALTHLLYAGRIASLSVRGSHFHGGHDGHLIKSRAGESLLAYNMIRDGPDGRASYELNLPNGGVATLIGNVIVQSPQTQNQVLVSYGEEGNPWERNALRMAHNTLVNEGAMPARFLRVATDRLPNLSPVVAINNLVVGPGTLAPVNAGQFAGNWHASLDMLRDVAAGAFELPTSSMLRGRGIDPRDVDAGALVPGAEFEWPVGSSAISAARTRWSPGAFQR